MVQVHPGPHPNPLVRGGFSFSLRGWYRPRQAIGQPRSTTALKGSVTWPSGRRCRKAVSGWSLRPASTGRRAESTWRNTAIRGGSSIGRSSERWTRLGSGGPRPSGIPTPSRRGSALSTQSGRPSSSTTVRACGAPRGQTGSRSGGPTSSRSSGVGPSDGSRSWRSRTS